MLAPIMPGGYMATYESSVGPKGQVTIPREVRRRWGLRPKDRIAFQVEAGIVTVVPARSLVEDSFGAVPPLAGELTVEEMTEIAAEEHAREAAREGLSE